MAITKEEIKELVRKRRVKAGVEKPHYFEGGFISDVIDVVQTPQYALTGLISGKGPLKGIKERLMPSEALNIKSPWAAFAVDVITDPLMYIGIGGVTKAGAEALAKGTAKRTLAAAAKAGERGLVTATLPFAKGGVSLVPKALTKKVFTAMTKAGQAWKITKPGQVITRALRLSPGIKGASTLAKVEEAQKAIAVLKRFVHLGEKAKQVGMSDTFNKLYPLAKKVDKFLKKGVVTMDDVSKFSRKLEVADDISKGIKLHKALKPVYKELKPIVDELHELRKGLGLTDIPGKRLAAVATKPSREAMEAEAAQLGRGARKVGFKEPMETYVKLVDVNNPLLSVPVKRSSVTKGVGLLNDKGYTYVPKLKLSLSRISGIGKKRLKRLEEKGITSVKQLASTNPAKIAKAVYGRTDITALIEAKRIRREALDQVAKFVKLRGGNVFVDNQLLPRLKYLGKGSDKFGRPIDVTGKIFKRVPFAAGERNKALEAAGKALRFEEKPFLPIMVTAGRVTRAQETNKIVEALKDIGTKLKKGQKIPDGFARSTLPELKGYVFPAGAVEHLDSTYQAFTNIKEVKAAINLYDKALNTWKGLATFVNPAFHTRNWVSNWWQNYLAGMNPLDPDTLPSYAKAHKMLWKVRKARTTKEAYKMLSGDEKKIYQAFVRQGLGGTGWFGADIVKEFDKFRKNYLFEAGGAVGRYVEDSAKLAHFIFKKSKGFIDDAAADSVRRFLFDYADLTPFEQNVMKRIFPFYTWSRNNIPLQVAMLIQHPGKYGAVAKAKRAIENTVEAKPMDDKLLPEWMREGYNVFLGKDSQGLHNYWALEGYLPAIDLNKIGRPLEFPLEMLSPLLKSPVELASNYNFFYEKEIEDYDGEREYFLGRYLPAKVVYLLRQIRPLTEANRLLSRETLEKNPTLGKRFFEFIVGKFRTFDERKQKKVLNYLKSIRESKVKKGMREARRRGETEEVKRLYELLKKVQRGEEVKI